MSVQRRGILEWRSTDPQGQSAGRASFSEHREFQWLCGRHDLCFSLAELRPFWVVDDLADCSNQSTADRAYHSKSGSSSSAEQTIAAAAVAGALEFGAGVSTKSSLRFHSVMAIAVIVASSSVDT